jgi:hypothetical protein
MLSSPKTPFRESSPDPPLIVSSPKPPNISSFLANPNILSSPPSQFILSSLAVPAILSSPSVPLQLFVFGTFGQSIFAPQTLFVLVIPVPKITASVVVMTKLIVKLRLLLLFNSSWTSNKNIIDFRRLVTT